MLNNTLIDYNINIIHIYIIYIYMLSVTETVIIALGTSLILFMLIPCCAYWFKLCDVTQFSRHQEPLHGQAVI